MKTLVKIYCSIRGIKRTKRLHASSFHPLVHYFSVPARFIKPPRNSSIKINALTCLVFPPTICKAPVSLWADAGLSCFFSWVSAAVTRQRALQQAPASSSNHKCTSECVLWLRSRDRGRQWQRVPGRATRLCGGVWAFLGWDGADLGAVTHPAGLRHITFNTKRRRDRLVIVPQPLQSVVDMLRQERYWGTFIETGGRKTGCLWALVTVTAANGSFSLSPDHKS